MKRRALDPETAFRVTLIAASVLAVVVAAGFSVRGVLARSDSTALAPEQAATLILDSQQFQQPLYLTVPMSDVIHRGSRQAATYAALDSLGWFEAQATRSPYRGKSQGVRLVLTAKGRTAAGQNDWEFDDGGDWQLPLATRELLDSAEMLGSHSETGAATYRFSWRWRPTDTGAGLNPMLGSARVPTEKVFRGRALFQRQDRAWRLTEISPEHWTN